MTRMANREDASVEETVEGDVEELEVELGDPLYTETGTAVGIVQGIDETRLVVSVREGAALTGLERHQRSGQGFGEAELMWRCMNCGEMGEIEDGLPENCPNCGESREELMYWTED